MVLGYFIIIFIPVIAFGLYYYNQLYENMIEEYTAGKQQIVEHSVSNLQRELLQAESTYQLFQYNRNIIEFLSTSFSRKADYYYNFMKVIRPLISFTLSTNSNINDIQIYVNDENMYPAPEIIYLKEQFPTKLLTELEELYPGQGKWIVTRSDNSIPRVEYYQKIYDHSFTKELGIISIQLKENFFGEFIESLSDNGSSKVHIFQEDDLIEQTNAHSLSLKDMKTESSKNFFHNNKRSIVNRTWIDELGLVVEIEGDVNNLFKNNVRQQINIIILTAGLLITLSGIYYAIFTTTIRRIHKLARHMSDVEIKNFEMVEFNPGQDEIGLLVKSYHSMLKRIDQLVNKVQKSEILRKEAAYKALQAQIKPHFLYNTLETIRMLAEANDDNDVAEITFSFGRLMRYILSHENEETSLADEIRIIDHYLKIHKIRLGKRLEYNMNIESDLNKIPCPRFILQPLVENCIIHGFTSINRESYRIDINVEEDDCYINIKILDNGIGIAKGKLNSINKMLEDNKKGLVEDEESHGLFNVNERIKAFYGLDSYLEIKSEECVGTIYNLYLNKKGMYKHVKAFNNR